MIRETPISCGKGCGPGGADDSKLQYRERLPFQSCLKTRPALSIILGRSVTFAEGGRQRGELDAPVRVRPGGDAGSAAAANLRHSVRLMSAGSCCTAAEAPSLPPSWIPTRCASSAPIVIACGHVPRIWSPGCVYTKRSIISSVTMRKTRHDEMETETLTEAYYSTSLAGGRRLFSVPNSLAPFPPHFPGRISLLIRFSNPPPTHPSHRSRWIIVRKTCPRLIGVVCERTVVNVAGVPECLIYRQAWNIHAP